MINKDTLKINQRKHHGSGSRSCDNLQLHLKLSLFCLSSKPSKWFIFKEFSTLQQQESEFDDESKIKNISQKTLLAAPYTRRNINRFSKQKVVSKGKPASSSNYFFYGILQALPGLTEIPMTFQFSFKGTSGGDGMVKS